jgi:hypothetical protein
MPSAVRKVEGGSLLGGVGDATLPESEPLEGDEDERIESSSGVLAKDEEKRRLSLSFLILWGWRPPQSAVLR